ncbi:MAG TPA: hypothetical protein VME24_07595 [Alphaproteobacteria bacterium]|nr:hypothetical protein [Alphaproteobacteria bacterium]
MINPPASYPAIPVIVGAIVVAVGWPATAYVAYRLGFRSQRVRMEWEAQEAKKSVHRKFIELANRFKTTVSISERPDNWVDFFKDNVAGFVSDYEKIRPDLKWNEKKRMDEAMNSIKRFAAMNHEEIRAACRNDSELFDALKKFPEM